MARAAAKAIAKPFAVDDQVLRIGASVGCAMRDAADTAIDEVVRRADRALYQMKARAGASPAARTRALPLPDKPLHA